MELLSLAVLLEVSENLTRVLELLDTCHELVVGLRELRQLDLDGLLQILELLGVALGDIDTFLRLLLGHFKF